MKHFVSYPQTITAAMSFNTWYRTKFLEDGTLDEMICEKASKLLGGAEIHAEPSTQGMQGGIFFFVTMPDGSVGDAVFNWEDYAYAAYAAKGHYESLAEHYAQMLVDELVLIDFEE